jgi:uncharacterized surface protein with fasciclin (FAS1) repeats
MNLKQVVGVGAVVLAGSAWAQCSGAAKVSACSGQALASSCGGEEAAVTLAAFQDTKKPSGDIVDTAVGAGSFKTLVAAVKAAGLVEALKGEGPFTVFAPTDEAFAKLPAGTVENLLKPENVESLRAILKYHVVPGKVGAEQVVSLTGAKTLNGQRVEILASETGVKVDNANVVKADIWTTNGVIHVIDRVILPESKNIVEVADAAGSFSTLLAAVKAAGLAGVLSGEGPFTVFAPTDEAFQALGASTINDLLKPENKGKLAEILKFHVVPGRVFGADALKAGWGETVQGGKVKFAADGDRVTVNGAGVVASDIDASNGVIHVIDRVLLPN